jgi:hypothetical protein
MPEHEPEQELGPKIADAFQHHADTATGLQGRGMAAEARRRVRKRRQALSMAAAAAVVAVAIGGVWNLASSDSPVASTAGDSSGQNEAAGAGKATKGFVPPQTAASCPADHPILKAPGGNAVPAGTGLDVNTPVQGLRACRYQLTTGALLGEEQFSPETAQQVVNAIKVLPEQNPDLPVFRCTPETARPSEAIVLRFETAADVREIWVEYDGCESPGFFTGTHTYGLYAAPLKFFMVGKVRPSGGTYLDALKDW